MDTQSHVASHIRSRMTKHNKSAMRRSIAEREESSGIEDDTRDPQLIVLLGKGDKANAHQHGHGLVARHMLDKSTSDYSFAEISSQLSPAAIEAIRDDWSYHTMAYAFFSAAAALYLFYVILDYPRLLARLFSSPIRPKKIEQVQSDDKLEKFNIKGSRTMGGEFWTGWVLRAGSSDSREIVITAPFSESGESSVSSASSTGSSTLDEKQEYSTAETPITLPAVHPRLVSSHPAAKTSRSNDILFSYYGSSDQPQEVPTLSYHRNSVVVRAAHVIEMDNNPESGLRRESIPQTRCLTGPAGGHTKQQESVDSLSSTGSSISPDVKSFDDDVKSSSKVAHVYHVNTEKAVKVSRRQVYAPPPHIGPLMIYAPHIQRILLWTPMPGLLPHVTLASVILVSLYLFLVLFATFFRASYEFDWMGPDVMRGGMIGMMQIPIIFGLGGRNSVFRFLLFGRHTNAALRIHKLAGRLCFLCSALHVGLWMRTWVIAGKLAKASASPHIIWGYVAIASLALLTITSLPFIRRMAHGFFMSCHVVGFTMFLVGLALHISEAVPYCLAGACLYGADILLRASRTRFAEANLQVAPGTDSTIVSVPGLKEGWRAGQHIVVRIPKMGGLDGIEGHEFTIASAPGAEGLRLIIKNAGNWSKKLRDISLESDKTGSGLSTRVIVEGPYGGPGNMIFQSFSAVLLVAGGSGITHSLGIAHDLIRKASMPPYNVRARTIEIVWATKTQESVQGLLPIFHQLIAYAKRAEKESPYGTTLKIHIYVTRQPASFPMRIASIVPTADKLSPNATGNGQSPPGAGYHQPDTSGLRIVPGVRPNLGATLNEIADSMTASESGVEDGHRTRRRIAQGIAVGVCGPDALVVDMRQAVRDALQTKGAAVGGIELLEESFSH
ncbi:hypothetical protein QFC22_004580 [Naganishia vaughanmartiniae]|uniref:Uncharacterized protein n=1 Tax=Naganishia vaughanmartiniae TaxID=1424756 RepID=A0ACC2X0Y1_9TREE|nr:hypothetical protein QFC22_004580 [Naganishia vaughanmartiniae]